MHTRCPHCDTCFRVTPEHLELAKGAVRCGRCFNTFNARDYLIDSPQEGDTPKTQRAEEEPNSSAPPPGPEGAETKPAEARPTTEKEGKEERGETPSEEPEESSPPPDSDAGASGKALPDDDGHNHSDHALELLHEIESRSAEDKRRSARRTLAGLATIVLLIVTLIGQYLYANRNTLAQNVDARPWLEAVCAVAGCDIPLLRMPEQVKLVDRGIRKHPQHSNALLVEAEMVNEAPFVQAYPIIKLTLHDITGKILSGRSFTPDEYLATNIDQRTGMPPGENLKITLVLVDPGDEAVGFEFDFN